MKETASIILFIAIIFLIAWQLVVIPGVPQATSGLSAEFEDLPDYGQFIVLASILTFFYFYFQKS